MRKFNISGFVRFLLENGTTTASFLVTLPMPEHVTDTDGHILAKLAQMYEVPEDWINIESCKQITV